MSDHRLIKRPPEGQLLFLLTISFCCVLFLSCERQKNESVQTEGPPVLVRAFVIPSGSVEEIRTFPIFAKEAQTAKLAFRVPGQLLEFEPILGKPVAKDEVVARLDPRDYQLTVERLKQSIIEANAALSAMKTGARAEDIAALESQITGAQTAVFNAKKQLDRMENLRQDGTASEVQYDLAKTTHDAVLAQLETLQTQLAKAKAGARAEEIEAMEAKIAGLHVDLTLAENKLGDTELKAPFVGVISQKFRDNHEMVLPATSILELVDTGAIEATLNVTEEIVFRKDQIGKINCRFQSIPDTLFAASVKEIGQTVQQGNLAYPLTVRIDLSEIPAEQKILPGMVGTAEITLTGKRERINIPSAALIPGPSGDPKESAVWVINGETIERRPIRVASFGPEGAVVESGLADGEKIVGAGARFLSDGEKIRTE